MNAEFLYSFVDRDMLMRYEWGMGIGHTYSWKNPMVQHHASDSDGAFADAEEPDDPTAEADSGSQPDGVEDVATFCLGDRENEYLDDEEFDEDLPVESEEEASCDEDD
jgi:hypothetical protein